MKMLMLTLPFMVRDLIAPEVLQYMHVLVCTTESINRAIEIAKKGSRLYCCGGARPVHGVEYCYLPVPHFRVRAARIATEGSGSPEYATGKPARQGKKGK
jgi:hypothetical protein